jgi:hypothetical protein
MQRILDRMTATRWRRCCRLRIAPSSSRRGADCGYRFSADRPPLLAPKEAVGLLGAIVGEGRTTAAELARIAELCGLLPLALRIGPAWMAAVFKFPKENLELRKRAQMIKRHDALRSQTRRWQRRIRTCSTGT